MMYLITVHLVIYRLSVMIMDYNYVVRRVIEHMGRLLVQLFTASQVKVRFGNPFTPKSDQLEISPAAASPEISHDSVKNLA